MSVIDTTSSCWYGRGWIDLTQHLLIPHAESSPYLHVPVAVTPPCHDLARAGTRLDLEGTWDGEVFTPRNAFPSRNQQEQHRPDFRGRYLPANEVMAVHQTMPEAEEVAVSYRPISSRDDPIHTITHLELGVTRVTPQMEQWRTDYEYGDLIDFRTTAGPCRRYLFD